jgi:hypothetical protein
MGFATVSVMAGTLASYQEQPEGTVILLPR